MSEKGPKRKKARGRPARPLPPKVDATPEEMARAIFALPADHEWEYDKPDIQPIYRCKACKRLVKYPETLYRDRRCKDCRKAPVK